GPDLECVRAYVRPDQDPEALGSGHDPGALLRDRAAPGLVPPFRVPGSLPFHRTPEPPTWGRHSPSRHCPSTLCHICHMVCHTAATVGRLVRRLRKHRRATVIRVTVARAGKEHPDETLDLARARHGDARPPAGRCPRPGTGRRRLPPPR